MSQDYPTDEQIDQIKKWEFHDRESFVTFMDFIYHVGKYWLEGWGWTRKGRHYEVSTGGWSGNEEILNAMQENFMFWSLCWQSHKRGGHYEFKLPDPKVYFKKNGTI